VHARRLDPAVRVSAGHTCFMLGDYEGVLDYEAEGLNYMRNLAFIMLNRMDEARAALLKAIDTPTPNLLAIYDRSLLRLVEGDIEGSRTEIRSVMSIHDPEGRFYGARHLAHLGDHKVALTLLSGAVDDGYFCVPAFARDPWLDDIRGTPEFAEIVRRAEVRHRQALISFLTAEGDRVLGIAQPV
jgi:hypothetical protein